MKRPAILFSLVIAILSMNVPAWAQLYTWSGGSSGSWADPTKWTPNRFTPTVNDTIVINAPNVAISDLSNRVVKLLLISGGARVTLNATEGATQTVTGTRGISVEAGSSLTLSPGVTLRSIGKVANNGTIDGGGILQCEGSVGGSGLYAIDITLAGVGVRGLESSTNIVGDVTVNVGTTLSGRQRGVALNIEGTLTNSGSIRDDEGHFTVSVNGSIVNNGIWENTATNLIGTGTLSGANAFNTNLNLSSSANVTVSSSITSYGEVTIEPGGILTVSSGKTLLAQNNMNVTRRSADGMIAKDRAAQSERSSMMAYARINGPGQLRFGGYGKTFRNEGYVEAATFLESNDGDVKSIAGTGGEWKSLTITRAAKARFSGYQVFTGAPYPLAADGAVTFSANNTISYRGASAQTICPVTYRRLEISNPAEVTMPAGVAILESISILRGNLNTGSDTLTLSPFAAIEEGGGSVIGNLRVVRACTTGVNQNFGGVGIEVNPQSYIPYPAEAQIVQGRATHPSIFTVAVTRVTGIAPTMSGTTFVERYFSLSTTGDGLNARLMFQYRPEQLPGLTESDLQLYESTNGGSTWIARGGTVDTAANRITVSRINSLNRLTVGHPSGTPPTLTSVSPQFGGLGESLVLTLTGTNFTGGSTAVAFSGTGITVNSVTFVSATQLSVNVSVAEGSTIGMRSITVTTPAGPSALQQGFDLRRPVPALSNISPASGAKGMSIAVTLSGTGFVNGSTTASFGDGITVSSIIGNSTSMTAQVVVMPSANAGARNVTVMTPPPGGGSSTLNGAFAVVNPPPGLTSISPSSASKGSIVSAVITGSDFFTNVTSLNLGTGITVDSIVVLSSTRFHARLSLAYEEHSSGPRDVSVLNAAPGGGLATLNGGFTVTNPAPSLTSLTPATAGRGSLVNVTVLGTQFISGVTTVSFGADILVTNTSVKSPTEMLVGISISSAATTGSRIVTVTNASPGGGAATLPTGFAVNSGPATGIEGNLGLIPDEYVLQEAYPNPFNPSTRIRYGIPEDSRVELVVHNMLGNVVAQLIHGERAKGLYELQWHADNLPSGVYLIRLNAESVESTKRFLASRKVVLVK